MKPIEPTVFIVDDDKAMIESLCWLIESDGLSAVTYTNAQDFIANNQPSRPGCLLLDIRMPGMSGLELQEKLNAQHNQLPIIFMTGHGDISMAVRAMKMGAFDFLIKPFSDLALLETLHKAIDKNATKRTALQQFAEIAMHISTLTPREREIMNYVVDGKLNKTISAELGIGPKTVEIHRSRIMTKMGAKSLAKLVQKVLIYNEEFGINE